MRGGSYVVDSTRYFEVRAAPGHEWNGNLNAKHVGLVKSGAGIAYVVNCEVNFTKFRDLLVRNSVVVNGFAGGFMVGGNGALGDDIEFHRCGVHHLRPNTRISNTLIALHGGFGIRTSAGTYENIKYVNCVVNWILKTGNTHTSKNTFIRALGFYCGTDNASNIEYINCTAGNMIIDGTTDGGDDGELDGRAAAFEANQVGDVRWINCFGFNCDEVGSFTQATETDNFYYGSGTPADANHDYNASEDATAPGSNAQQSLTVANQIISETKETPNFSVLSGASLRDNGSDQSSDFTDDATGQSVRTSIFDIGAYEYEGVHIYGNVDIFGNTDINNQ